MPPSGTKTPTLPDMDDGLRIGEDGRARCRWGGGENEDYRAYHDTEWGMPVADDRRLLEKLCLEGFQAGLSWLTILRKRPAFREVYADFDPVVVAGYGPKEVKRLLQDERIIRHCGKIEAAIDNARASLDVIEEFGSLAAYIWRFEPPPEERPAVVDWAALSAMTETPASRRLAKDLRSRGFRFVGPTTVYAFMQAMGLVNDHIEGCFARETCIAARAAFAVPA
jgi:DNA-3-methyladenine glycosylase I